MKKLLFLLFALVTVTMQAQTANGSETQLEGIQLTAPQTVTSVSYLSSMGTTGVIGRINPVLLPLTTATINAITAAATPDATTTVKGKLKLAGDLGGTADLPTTPTSLHKTGDETSTGIKTFANLSLSANTINSNLRQINQVTAGNDFWKIYGTYSTLDNAEMVLEVGDNGTPYGSGGQRFRFHYDASFEGIAKDPFIIDYNDSRFYTNLALDSETINTIASFDASKNIKSLSTTTYPSLTELAYVKGVTSPIQTQLNNRVTTSGTQNTIQKKGAGNTLVDSIIKEAGDTISLGAKTGASDTPTNLRMDNTFTSSPASTSSLKYYLLKAQGEAYGFGLGDNSDIRYWAGADSGEIGRHVFYCAGNKTLDISKTISTFNTRVSASPAVLDTELATLGQVKTTSRPYKVYTALMSQTGTSNPVVTVLENTLGFNISWGRNTAGHYIGSTTGGGTVFNTSKTLSFTQSGGGFFGIRLTPSGSETTMLLDTLNSAGTALSDGMLNNSSIEIRIYP